MQLMETNDWMLTIWEAGQAVAPGLWNATPSVSAMGKDESIKSHSQHCMMQAIAQEGRGAWWCWKLLLSLDFCVSMETITEHDDPFTFPFWSLFDWCARSDAWKWCLPWHTSSGLLKPLQQNGIMLNALFAISCVSIWCRVPLLKQTRDPVYLLPKTGVRCRLLWGFRDFIQSVQKSNWVLSPPKQNKIYWQLVHGNREWLPSASYFLLDSTTCCFPLGHWMEIRLPCPQIIQAIANVEMPGPPQTWMSKTGLPILDAQL